MTKRNFHKQSLMGIFLSYFRPHMGLFLLDMVCALVISLVDLGFPYLSRMCMYELIPEGRFQAFVAVILILLAAYLIRSVMQYIVTYWGHTFGVLVEADIRRDLFSHLQTLSFGFYDKNRTGHLMSRMTAELFDITELAHHGPEDVFISGVTVVGAIAIMFTIQWRLALVLLILIPLFMVVVFLNRRSMAETSKRVKQTTAGINADIESTISGMRTAKAFSNEGAESEKFQGANERFKTSKRDYYRAMARFNSSMEFFLCIMPVDGHRRGRPAHHGRADDLRGPDHLQPLHLHLHQPYPQALQPLGDAGQRFRGPAAVRGAHAHRAGPEGTSPTPWS